MTTNTVTPQTADLDLQRFIDSIPSPDAIRSRLNRNADETAVLKKLLRLAVAAERERAGRELQPVA